MKKNQAKVSAFYYRMAIVFLFHLRSQGWLDGAMVLDKLTVPGRTTIWITVGQGPSALAVGTGGCYSVLFTVIYPFFLSLPLFGRRPDID